MLDWEISTLGHPLADLAYLMRPWYTPGGFMSGIGVSGVTGKRKVQKKGKRNDDLIEEEGYLPEGIPTELEFLEQYCKRRNIEMVSSSEWSFWKVSNTSLINQEMKTLTIYTNSKI